MGVSTDPDNFLRELVGGVTTPRSGSFPMGDRVMPRP